MGAPAAAVFKSSGSEKAAGPVEDQAKLMFATWPLVQSVLAFGISTLATYCTLTIALAAVAIFGSLVCTYLAALGMQSLDRTLLHIHLFCASTLSLLFQLR